MNFIKNLIKKLSDSYVEFFKSYLLTNIAIIISTILLIIFVDTNTGYEIFQYAIFFCINFFTIENYFKNKTSRVVGYAIATVASFVFGYLFVNHEEAFSNFFIFYVISMASINLYCIIKETKLELSAYLHKVFSNLVTTTVINIILTIGVIAVISIITALLIPDHDGDLFLRTLIAIWGFYTVPAYLYAFINKKTEITELANVLLKYVIVPLTYIALLVVYLYIIKIVVTTDMPSNSVFAIILALFIVSIPVFVLVKELKIKNKLVNFIDNNISYIFIPLYLLQAYALIIRISTYGLTEERYLGIMVLIIEAIILFLMKYKERKHLSLIFFIIVVASAITFIVPKINYEDLSITLQANRIERVMAGREFKALNGEEQAKVVGSYNYLDAKDALDKVTVKLDKEEMRKKSTRYDYFYETYEAEEKEIDISSYSKMKTIMESIDAENAKVKIYEYTVDFEEVVNKLIEHEEIEGSLIYELDESHDLYVLSLNINGYDGKLNNINVTGYILTK